MLEEKRIEVSSQANKLRNGLWKIDDCKEKVESMSVELEEAQVKVAEFQQQCDEYLVIIIAQRKEADEQQVSASIATKTNLVFVFLVLIERSHSKKHQNWGRGSAMSATG